MSIILPGDLPAKHVLLAEGIDVFEQDRLRASRRAALRICLVNLMPNKAVTELQFARLLGRTSVPVELTLCVPDGYLSKSLTADQSRFYRDWSEVRWGHYDGLIVTGAPIELLPYERVTYWASLRHIFDWARARAMRSLYICWAAQAALYHFHGVGKRRCERKIFGVYQQHVLNSASRLMRGFEGDFRIPVSRHTEIRGTDLPANAGLTILAASRDSGICLIEDRKCRTAFMFNHFEYDAGSLLQEYHRDISLGREIALPQNYFPHDDPQLTPPHVWQRHSQLFFANWLAQGIVL